MAEYRLNSFSVQGLWGKRDLNLEFLPDVNILIGPNGSGKTTLLNLIRWVLTADVAGLSQHEFAQIEIKLDAFDASSTRTIRVRGSEDGYEFQISRRKINVSTRAYLERRFLAPRARREFEEQLGELASELRGLVPAVWLPVTRRLPIPEADPEPILRRGRRQAHLESVDRRLEELVQELADYRVGLEARLARRYKRFERDVLSALIYTEYEEGTLKIEAPDAEEKQQLLRAFKGADLLGPEIQRRIDRYYTAATNAMKAFENEPNKITNEQLRILPLIPRTKEMAKLATALEEDRVEVFRPLRRYERIVNGFFRGKAIAVAEDGALRITHDNVDRTFRVEELSSGEKQLLILLTEALLREGQPVVYVADEPELSLHVEWQEQLLSSLVELAEEVQLIVATHSPDIVGPYRSNILKLGTMGLDR